MSFCNTGSWSTGHRVTNTLHHVPQIISRNFHLCHFPCREIGNKSLLYRQRQMGMQEKVLVRVRSDNIAINFQFLNTSDRLIVAQNLTFWKQNSYYHQLGPQTEQYNEWAPLSGRPNDGNIHNFRNTHCKRSLEIMTKNFIFLISFDILGKVNVFTTLLSNVFENLWVD